MPLVDPPVEREARCVRVPPRCSYYPPADTHTMRSEEPLPPLYFSPLVVFDRRRSPPHSNPRRPAARTRPPNSKFPRENVLRLPAAASAEMRIVTLHFVKEMCIQIGHLSHEASCLERLQWAKWARKKKRLQTSSWNHCKKNQITNVH